MNNKKLQLSGPMLANLDRLVQEPESQQVTIDLATTWCALLNDMMDYGLGEAVSVRYAANCLEAWLGREQRMSGPMNMWG